MEGYKINTGQKQAIENTLLAKAHFFYPVEDINGDWFIFEEEMNAVVINGAFKNAAKMEYVPPIQEEEL